MMTIEEDKEDHSRRVVGRSEKNPRNGLLMR